MKKSFRKRKYSKKRYKTDKKRKNIKKRRYTKRKNKKKTLRLTGGSRGSQSDDELFQKVTKELGPIATYEAMYNDMCDYKKKKWSYHDYMNEKQPGRDISKFEMLWDSITDGCKKIRIFTNESNEFDLKGDALKKIIKELRGLQLRHRGFPLPHTMDTDSFYQAVYSKSAPDGIRTIASIYDLIKYGDTKYLFTRHAQSCNNVATGLSGSLKKLMDPQITLEGMRTAYESSRTKSVGDTSFLYDSDVVYVSCLVRTWMTALLLYNGHRESPRQEFTLRVIPFIKEKLKYGFFESGNTPTDLMYTISSFLNFLNKLNNIKNMSMDNMPAVINVRIYFPGNEKGSFSSGNIIFKKGGDVGNSYTLNCPDRETLGILEYHFNNANSIFRIEGDIKRCMLSGILMGANMIHIVSHNEIMQEFLEQFMESGFRKIVRNGEGSERGVAAEDEMQVSSQGEPEILSHPYLKTIKDQNIYSFELGKSRIPEKNYTDLKEIYLVQNGMAHEFPEQRSVGGVYLNTIYEGYVSEGGTFSQNKEDGICIEIPEEDISRCR
jgi:hypothetical protein